MKKHLDFRFDIFFYILLFILVIIVPGSLYLPAKYGYENGIIENIQMVVLFVSCFFALRATEHKKFYNLVLMILIILILREVNCGRTLFFPIPNVENAFYSWKEIPYGWLAHPLYGIYIASTVIYGLCNKFWKDLWIFLSKTKLPVWNILFLFMGIILSLVAEKMTVNFVFEEFSELLMYVSIFGIIYLYSKKKYLDVE